MAGGELRFGTASIYMAKHEHIRRSRTSTKNWITWLRFRPISACVSSHFNGLIVMERRKLGLGGSPSIAIGNLYSVDRLGALGFFLFVNLGRLLRVITTPQPA